MDEVDIPGATLRVDQSGRGAPAIFVHGFGGDLHTWDALWRALGADCAALRYDLRGFGRSIGAAGEAFDHAADLLALSDARGLEFFDLIGVSMGGAIALNFALDHPERVRRLVLISPGMVGWEWSEDWRAQWSAIEERARAGALDEARALYFRHPMFDGVRGGAEEAALRQSIAQYSGAHWIKDDHVLKMPDIERVHALAAPTLLLSGERDLPDFQLIAEVINASAAHVTHVRIPGCGHMLNLEAPEICAEAVSAFLGGEAAA